MQCEEQYKQFAGYFIICKTLQHEVCRTENSWQNSLQCAGHCVGRQSGCEAKKSSFGNIYKKKSRNTQTKIK